MKRLVVGGPVHHELSSARVRRFEMPVSQQHISSTTPPGATLVPGGATFRVWAPGANAVHIAIAETNPGAPAFQPSNDTLLIKDSGGFWNGFVPGVVDGTMYRFFVVGGGSQGFKRDPYARELERDGYPECDCIVRAAHGFSWHDAGFVPPRFKDLIIYQFHFGVYYAKDAQGNDIRPRRVCQFLDVVDRIEYLADLGVNAIMPLPFQEFQTDTSLGYNGTDLFSPEMDYAVRSAALPLYLPRVNRLLTAKGQLPLTALDLTGQVNQLKAFIDLCHLYGIAVIADVVYNHAGGGFG